MHQKLVQFILLRLFFTISDFNLKELHISLKNNVHTYIKLPIYVLTVVHVMNIKCKCFVICVLQNSIFKYLFQV